MTTAVVENIILIVRYLHFTGGCLSRIFMWVFHICHFTGTCVLLNSESLAGHVALAATVWGCSLWQAIDSPHSTTIRISNYEQNKDKNACAHLYRALIAPVIIIATLWSLLRRSHMCLGIFSAASRSGWAFSCTGAKTQKLCKLLSSVPYPLFTSIRHLSVPHAGCVLLDIHWTQFEWFWGLDEIPSQCSITCSQIVPSSLHGLDGQLHGPQDSLLHAASHRSRPIGQALACHINLY